MSIMLTEARRQPFCVKALLPNLVYLESGPRSADVELATTGKRPVTQQMRQRVTQPLAKRKPLPRREVHAVRPETKVTLMKENTLKVVNKRPANRPVSNKPATKTNHVDQVKKPESKKQEVVKEPEKSPETLEQADSTSGHYELNELMTKMVDAELQDIMTKIWQELPDNPPTETECVIVDTLRNQASVDLRNILGLNITKRLLNVYNPLNIKVQFSGKPEKEALRELLKKYNITAFARKAINIFSAQVRSIDDFDRICADQDIRCGDVKVTVSPIYAFAVCPPNLKTNYGKISFVLSEAELMNNDIDTKTAEVKKENTESPNKSVTKSAENIPVEVKEGKTKVEVKQTDNSTNKPNEVKKPEVNNKPAQNAVNTATQEKQANNIPTKPSEVKKLPNEVKPAQNTANTDKQATQAKNVPAKPTEAKKVSTELKPTQNTVNTNKPEQTKTLNSNNQTNITKTENKVTPAPTKVANVTKTTPSTAANVTKTTPTTAVNTTKTTPTTAANAAKTNQPATTTANVTQTTTTTASNVTKTTPTKVAAVAKTIPTTAANVTKPTPTTAANVTKTTPAKVTPAKLNVNKTTPTKVTPAKSNATKPTPAKVTPAKSNVTKVHPKKTNKVEDDFDELDDRAILALMSEGIVLDECSGSDDD